MNWIIALFTNPFLIIPMLAWFTAQVLKTIIHAVINRKFDITRMFGDGGMPSGHSATVTSLAVLSALVYGCGSFQFAISAVLAIIVCHDAMGVRLETGKQAEVLNDLIDIIDMLTTEKLPEVKLKEFVGHTPVQVAAGTIVGIANAFAWYYLLF
jgi:acid phosphatase family membrane protein YuiD